MRIFRVGQNVICNGNRGVVREVCVGKLSNMYVVRLDAGEVCVSGQELDVKGKDLSPCTVLEFS